MKLLQIKSGRHYYLKKKPGGRKSGYRWVGLSVDPAELRAQLDALTSGAHIDEVLDNRAPGAWLEAQAALLYERVRQRSVAADIYCDLTRDQIRRMGNAQNWRCALTGLRFSLDRTANARARAFAPSVDRIDNALGYIESNCRLVCIAVNLALNDFGEDIFRHIALAYCRRNRLLQNRKNLADQQSTKRPESGANVVKLQLVT